VKIFLDTSSLIKLYFKEDGTSALEKIFLDNVVSEVFVSEIAKTEFFSAIYKKLRTKDLLVQDADTILNAFVADEHKFSFISVDSQIISASQKFIGKYGTNGLRALDAIQLASAYSVRDSIGLAVSNDKLLNTFLLSEKIQVSEGAP
jgi:predicted nucleic acid-binding protein